MLRLKLLPWEYGVRNLFRRPLRSGLTFCALATVLLLVMIVIGFVRGLETSMQASGDPDVILVYSLGMGENLEYSSISASTADLLPASLGVIKQRYGNAYVSAELYLATRIATTASSETTTGLVRGVTPSVLPVRGKVELVEGDWPGPGELIVGRLAATNLGRDIEELAVGRDVIFEGRKWRISGRFVAGGAIHEAELWCRLPDLQETLKRQDLSLLALKLSPSNSFAQLDMFCKERNKLELQASRETAYYATLSAHYRPVRIVAWLVVCLIASAGCFAAMNTMFASVISRTSELATLQTIGFGRGAILLSVLQEAMLLSMTATVTASLVAILFIDGMAMRFTMGAFPMQIDGTTLLVGCGIGFLLSLFGALPPSFRALRKPVIEGLRET